MLVSLAVDGFGVSPIRHASTMETRSFRPRILRNMILTEMVARTLKNILRSFQRKWMKAKRSTSEQGMRELGEQAPFPALRDPVLWVETSPRRDEAEMISLYFRAVGSIRRRCQESA